MAISLVEGAPGLAKTSAIRALAARLEADFARVQFTPDLLPADLTGTEVWRPQEGRFEFQPGPIFHPRAARRRDQPRAGESAVPRCSRRWANARSRSALPIRCRRCSRVAAPENPIEQETFPLPEAQLDRFLMYVRIGYPEAETETEILRLARERALTRCGCRNRRPCACRWPMCSLRGERCSTCVAPALERYLVELVLASRTPARYDKQLAERIAWGASPRGSIALERCARARA